MRTMFAILCLCSAANAEYLGVNWDIASGSIQSGKIHETQDAIFQAIYRIDGETQLTNDETSFIADIQNGITLYQGATVIFESAAPVETYQIQITTMADYSVYEIYSADFGWNLMFRTNFAPIDKLTSYSNGSATGTYSLQKYNVIPEPSAVLLSFFVLVTFWTKGLRN